MNLRDEFPLMVCLNLARRGDRRARMDWLFDENKLIVRRFPAIDASRVRNLRNFDSPQRYAHALSTRLIIRHALNTGAKSVFIFEDDVILAEEWESRLQAISLPTDWQMFYLGGQHHERPRGAAKSLVRVSACLDTHAWGIRRSAFREVLAALANGTQVGDSVTPATDIIVARLQRNLHCYAAYPNLAWQAEEHSDIAEGVYSSYDEEGRQKWAEHVVLGLEGEMEDCICYTPAIREANAHTAWFRSAAVPYEATAGHFDKRAWTEIVAPVKLPNSQPEPQVAFLFLTIAEHQHPSIWEEYWRDHEGNYAVYGHAAYREKLGNGWLQSAQIPKFYRTWWGSIWLVRAQLAMLVEALKNPNLTHFVFLSESCVPITPFSHLIRQLRIDGRSRFFWEMPMDVNRINPNKAARRKVAPEVAPTAWRFHPQWILLSREAAELIVEDDWTERFAQTFAPDECYFATMLNIKGFPLDAMVVRDDVTWTRWRHGEMHPETVHCCTSELIREWLAGRWFFARKLAKEANFSAWQLHK